MKRLSTDKLLTLGMALYADRRTMEQRVRGIFGRKRSTGFARAMAVALCLVVGVTCFTTACMPVREEAATGGNAATSGNAASAAAVPEPAASEAAISAVLVPTPPMDPMGSFIEGLEPAPFVPVTGPTRVLRNPVALSDGVTLTFDADVEIPEASAYPVVRMEKDGFTDADIARLNALFRVPGEPYKEEPFGSSENHFHYSRYGVFIAQESHVYYELDWQPAEIALFDEPNPLTRAETQPVAERAVRDMGATEYVLDSADKAIALDYDAEGAPYAVSRGWHYTFVPQVNGLTRHAYGGFSGSDRDPIFYYPATRELIEIYVDEKGVSSAAWGKSAAPQEAIEENVAILPLDEVIELATERLKRVYQNPTGEGNHDIRVQHIRLAAMSLGNNRGATEAYAVPVWEVEYSIAYDDAYRSLGMLPFNAVDGGAIQAVDFPF